MFFSGFGLVRYCDFVYNTTVCTSAGGKGRRCDDFADASLCVPRRVGGADYGNIDETSVFSFGVGLMGYCVYVCDTTVCTSAGGQVRRCDDIADASLCVPRRVGGADYGNIDGTSVFFSGFGLVRYCDYVCDTTV